VKKEVEKNKLSAPMHTTNFGGAEKKNKKKQIVHATEKEGTEESFHEGIRNQANTTRLS